MRLAEVCTQPHPAFPPAFSPVACNLACRVLAAAAAFNSCGDAVVILELTCSVCVCAQILWRTAWRAAGPQGPHCLRRYTEQVF